MMTRTGATINLTPALGFKATDFTEATVWDAPSHWFCFARFTEAVISSLCNKVWCGLLQFLHFCEHRQMFLVWLYQRQLKHSFCFSTTIQRCCTSLLLKRSHFHNGWWSEQSGQTMVGFAAKVAGIARTEKTLELLEVVCCFSFLFGSVSAKTWPRNELVRIADSFTNFTRWLNFAKCSSASRSTRSTNFRCRGTGRRFSKSEMSLTRKRSSTLP